MYKRNFLKYCSGSYGYYEYTRDLSLHDKSISLSIHHSNLDRPMKSSVGTTSYS